MLTMAAGGDSFGYLNLTTDSDDFVRRQQIQAFDEEDRPGAWICPGPGRKDI